MSQILRLSDYGARRDIPFDVAPDAGARAALAAELGILGIRKLRLSGRLTPLGRQDWTLEAELGATVVQACVVTLEPVTTRIDVPVTRRYLADFEPPATAGEVEMPEDDSTEPLSESVDPGAVLAEALALALPDFPRAPGAELGEAVYTETGLAPMRDEDARPFAGLKALRDGMDDKKND